MIVITYTNLLSNKVVYQHRSEGGTRVPAIGENVEYEDKEYKVRGISHYLSMPHLVSVFITPLSPTEISYKKGN